MMSEHSVVMSTVDDIDKLLQLLEEVLFDIASTEAATQSARTRRIQLLDVRARLLGDVTTLEL